MVSLHQFQPDEPSREITGPAGARLPQNRRDGSESAGGLAPAVLSGASPSVNPPPAETDRAVSPAPTASAADYGTFFRSTLAPLRRYIFRLIGSREEAQDIAQDAYAKVFKTMQDRPVEHPQALLYTTARHLAIDELKHRGRSPFEASAAPDVPILGAPGVEAIVMAREEAFLLEKAINQLPEECRQALLLRMSEQLTHEQIAQRLGLTRKQIEKRLYRAVHLLHGAMQARPHSSTTP